LGKAAAAVVFGGEAATITADGGVDRTAMAKLPDFDQWIDAIAPVVKLDIAPDQRAAVKANLKIAAKMAALLEKAALDDETGPAPVYRA
jgi:hypothetical protein